MPEIAFACLENHVACLHGVCQNSFFSYRKRKIHAKKVEFIPGKFYEKNTCIVSFFWHAFYFSGLHFICLECSLRYTMQTCKMFWQACKMHFSGMQSYYSINANQEE
jgi:hypothetical protein